MSGPISVDLPHHLGADEAKRRIAANIGGLAGHLPAGARVCSAWDGDRLNLGIGVMGQEAEAVIDVQENLVRVTVMLPPALAFFGKAIEAGLRHRGPQLLEDRTGK
jgi:putative polyhydroxyalkanoic acid system protein